MQIEVASLFYAVAGLALTVQDSLCVKQLRSFNCDGLAIIQAGQAAEQTCNKV